jgi:hypothetical protein
VEEKPRPFYAPSQGLSSAAFADAFDFFIDLRIFGSFHSNSVVAFHGRPLSYGAVDATLPSLHLRGFLKFRPSAIQWVPLRRCAPKIASTGTSIFRNDTGQPSLTLGRLESFRREEPMNILPIDRALSIYGALANRVETTGARERLSRHLMKLFIDGEKDQHRLTVHGLSFLQNIDREIDSRG